MVRMWGDELVPRFCRAACCLVRGTRGLQVQAIPQKQVIPKGGEYSCEERRKLRQIWDTLKRFIDFRQQQWNTSSL